MKKIFLSICFVVVFLLLGVFNNKVFGYLYLNNLDFEAKINTVWKLLRFGI